MNESRRFAVFCVICWAATAGVAAAGDRPIVIAHRGASGYLPEHTLEAAAMAYAMGADYIEQDVVISRDNVPVVLHDIHLDTVTDVASKFSGRARDDGRYYAIDFTLDEIKTLDVTERIDLETKSAVFPGRFPVGAARFEVPTLAEEIQMIQGLNTSTGRLVGIYVEVKSPAWHREQGKDISKITLDTLAEHGYRNRTDHAFVQCFDATETKRMRQELNTRLRLVQLIGENNWHEAETDFTALRTVDGLKEVASYADGIGPWMPHIVSKTPAGDALQVSDLVEQAHAAGLLVHPYTLRADSLPEYAQDFDEVLRIFLCEAKVDGVFTDFTDRVVQYLLQPP